MKDKVIGSHKKRPSRFTNGVRHVDGVAGFIRLQLIEIFQECAGELECDYTELTVADIFEYLVEWAADTERRMNELQ